MKKFVITFGSGQLTEFYVRPSTVMLVIEAKDENKAREQVFNFQGIGDKFCTSYIYDDVAKEFKTKYGMQEYTLDDLESKRLK